MLLIAEIVLTIIAWKRGWRLWVILPWAIVLGALLMRGLVTTIWVLAEILLVGVLILMAASPLRR